MCPGNQHIIRKIKTAREAGIRPLSLIFHEQPTKNWEPFDFLLLEAYQIIKDETCPKCGHPIWLCRADVPELHFTVQQDVCSGEKALKEEEWKNAKGDARKNMDKSQFGVFKYTVPSMYHERPLPTRSDYYKALSEVE